MLISLGRFFLHLIGFRSIHVVEDTPARLAITCGRVTTVFEKRSGRVVQHSKLAGVFAGIERVQLHQPRDREGRANWFVTVVLHGARKVEVGQTSDKEQASVVAACIAGATGRSVVVSAQAQADV